VARGERPTEGQQIAPVAIGVHHAGDAIIVARR
jgi:hypothetical protein